jgi:hypothetical protein
MIANSNEVIADPCTVFNDSTEVTLVVKEVSADWKATVTVESAAEILVSNEPSADWKAAVTVDAAVETLPSNEVSADVLVDSSVETLVVNEVSSNSNESTEASKAVTAPPVATPAKTVSIELIDESCAASFTTALEIAVV